MIQSGLQKNDALFVASKINNMQIKKINYIMATYNFIYIVFYLIFRLSLFQLDNISLDLGYLSKHNSFIDFFLLFFLILALIMFFLFFINIILFVLLIFKSDINKNHIIVNVFSFLIPIFFFFHWQCLTWLTW